MVKIAKTKRTVKKKKPKTKTAGKPKEKPVEELVKEKYQPIDMLDLRKRKITPYPFLIENLVPASAITIFSGHPSCGKSWLLLAIANSITSNESLFGHFKNKIGKVLYVDEESEINEMTRRIQKLEDNKFVVAKLLPQRGIRIDSEDDREWLLELTKKGGYQLIIFDSLSTIHSLDENSARDSQTLMDYLREFTRNNVAVILSHHLRKESFFGTKDPAQALRGSSNLLAQTDSLIYIEKTKELAERIEITIKQLKLRQGRIAAPFKLNLLEENGKIKFDHAGEIIEDDRKIELAKTIILEILEDEEKSRQDLINLLLPQDSSKRTTDRAIKELEAEKHIFPFFKGRKKYLKLG